MIYLYFTLGIAFNGIASFTLKLFSNRNENLLSVEVFKSPLLYLTLFLFGMNVVFYALFLKQTNLSIGYPAYIGGTFVIVLLFSYLFLQENLTLPQILGITLIFGGIILATR